jgi:hypothetical protein
MLCFASSLRIPPAADIARVRLRCINECKSHVTRRTSHVTRHTSHVARHTSHVTHHTSHVTRHTSHVTRHTTHVTRHTSHVARRTSHVTRHTSHVTRHTSHVTRHTSHVTRHTSHVTRNTCAPCLSEKYQGCPLQEFCNEGCKAIRTGQHARAEELQHLLRRRSTAMSSVSRNECLASYLRRVKPRPTPPPLPTTPP